MKQSPRNTYLSPLEDQTYSLQVTQVSTLPWTYLRVSLFFGKSARQIGFRG